MHTNLRLISLLVILSFSLIGLAGCGEKRIHVSTASGAPGDDVALEPLDETSGTQTAGLSKALVDESDLSSQVPDDGNVSGEAVELDMGSEPINMAHESSTVPIEDVSSDSSLADPMTSELTDNGSSFAPLGNGSSSAPLDEGQDFSTQSSSSGDHSNRFSNIEDFREPTTDQDSATGFQDILSGEGIEPIPDTLQIAKAEPSDGLQERMNRLKQEELLAAAAGLEDVFFQFDSWTLTQEGKQSLQRVLRWFEQNPSSNLIIEGHADQRGTQAYNMVLAKKRAVAVHDYLAQSGVTASRLAVISYGKDKPFCQDATEVCHQLNRRGHLLIPNQ